MKNESDTIYLDEPTNFPPFERASDKTYIKHVYCDGARFHVISYYLINGEGVQKCSEPNCIMNKPVGRSNRIKLEV